jgi:hypothetical protein
MNRQKYDTLSIPYSEPSEYDKSHIRVLSSTRDAVPQEQSGRTARPRPCLGDGLHAQDPTAAEERVEGYSQAGP